jgi:non-lysosomal glucosylceramidase
LKQNNAGNSWNSGSAVRSFDEKAAAAGFLLGGIGTGNVTLDSRGHLVDWEIFGRPGQGNYMPYQFFAIRTQSGNNVDTRILEAALQPPYVSSHGYHAHRVAGLPRMAGARLSARYPFAEVRFQDENLPVQVTLEAFTPFIPLNEDDSSIPGVVLRYRVRNESGNTVDVSVAGTLANLAGIDYYEAETWENIVRADDGRNEYRDVGYARGVDMTCEKLAPDHLRYGSLALLTDGKQVTYKTEWLDGGWWDGVQDYWDDFCADGRLQPASAYTQKDIKKQNGIKMAGLSQHARLDAGEETVFTFIVAWSYPNRARAWEQPAGPVDGCNCGCGTKEDGRKVQMDRNYYSFQFPMAWDAACYLLSNLPRLEQQSRAFTHALYSSTLPPAVIDALAANITVLRSPTCFRLGDGTFCGWEGCFSGQGCCEGTCTHVWNYAQTLAFLFPELEKSMRKVEFLLETNEDGRMAFRSHRVMGDEQWQYHAAADGQMGSIVRVYREWKLTGDDDFLKELWPWVKRALEFAFRFWDSDGDCVLDSQQHNTYDIEFYGPNSLTNSLFFAALKAAAAMAAYLGETRSQERYTDAWQKGSAQMDEMLFERGYYIQRIDDVNEFRYQYGKGCLSDQLFGQLLAHVAGLGYVLPPEHVKSAIKSVYDNNFLQSFVSHSNTQRTYALNDERGLVLCTWPHGGRPSLPFVYGDEVWTGIEYQVAAHLIYEGFVEEGVRIVEAVRDRHDGTNRNPWNEVECGNHYARSMASWALLPALSGFTYDMTAGVVDFNPAIRQENFNCFFSTGKAWGVYTQKQRKDGTFERGIEILYGDADAVRLS